jgi:hypothetical protein
MLGARAVVTGIQPEVAQAIVGHDLELAALEAYRTRRDALRECLSELPARRIRAREIP